MIIDIILVLVVKTEVLGDLLLELFHLLAHVALTILIRPILELRGFTINAAQGAVLSLILRHEDLLGSPDEVILYSLLLA